MIIGKAAGIDVITIARKGLVNLFHLVIWIATISEVIWNDSLLKFKFLKNLFPDFFFVRIPFQMQKHQIL
jgi:hypothetical protein